MSHSDLSVVAKRHGIDFGEVQPLDLHSRLERLREVLQRRDVPYPIVESKAHKYFAEAEAGIPFSTGSLTDVVVDLGEYANSQKYDEYTLEEHLSWACLIQEQQKTKSRFACVEYQNGEQLFEIGGLTIPDYYRLNARIYQQTGWQLATVNMIIPAELFFTCHSKQFFPVTTFMRPLGQDYLEEPDIGHDVAGHVATFTIPTVARLMQSHGLARDIIYEQRDQRLEKARNEKHAEGIRHRADELLLYAERIYWFSVEFGLVQQAGELRAFGAGILSSPGETKYSIASPEPTRILINPGIEKHLMRLVCTDYMISEFQKTYFVTEEFAQLDTLTPERIVRATEKAARLPHFCWRDVAPGDRMWNVGRFGTGVNEKYYQVLAGRPIDDCCHRTAIRNAQILAAGIDPLDDGTKLDIDQIWSAPLPDFPEQDLQAVAKAGEKREVELRPISFVADYL